MRTFRYSILLMLLVCISSCGHYLDVKPIGKMIPTEVSQFENLLNNSITIKYFFIDNNSSCFYSFMGDNLQMSENQANYQYTSTFPNLDLLAGYIFYQPVLNPLSTPFTWSSGIYKAVGYFNNVIDGVADIDDASEYAKGVIAQAKVGRAWIYLHAALTYGPMYNPGGTNDTKVIPCRISGDPVVDNGPLCTTDELLTQVKSDLDYACENCPASIANPCRANKAAAYALRAEYYMFLRDWTNMLSDCKTAWQLALSNKGSVDNLIYNYKDFYYQAIGTIKPEPGCSPEYYETLKGPDEKFTMTSNRENLLYRDCPYGAGVQKHYPSEDWKSLFDTNTDWRWKLFVFTIPGYSTTYGGKKYNDGNQLAYYRDDRTLCSEGITYPLLLLMKAEAEARNNSLGEALNDLNTLRKYRYSGTNTDLANGSSMSQDQLLNEILTERRREQPISSFQRTLDLKRYALDTGKPWSKTTITHKIGTKTYSKSITDAFYQSLPIDNAILEYNPQWGITPASTVFEPFNAR